MLPLKLAMLSLGLVAGGCSTRPLPEDSAGDTTVAIVQKIKCESRDALDEITTGLLRRYGDATAVRLADQIDRNEISAVEVINPPYFGTYVIKPLGVLLFKTYTLSAITFDFNLVMNEENDNAFDADFRMPLLTGLFTVGANAGVKLGRRNNRKFQVTTTFYELHRLSREACALVEARTANIGYPITGRIGLREVFETFVNIDSGGGLSARFTDTIRFTTTLTGGATPKIAVDPVSDRRFRLAGASATFKATRSDEHEVAIALARGPVVASFARSQLDAKIESKAIADELRIENLLDAQGRASAVLNGLLR